MVLIHFTHIPIITGGFTQVQSTLSAGVVVMMSIHFCNNDHAVFSLYYTSPNMAFAQGAGQIK